MAPDDREGLPANDQSRVPVGRPKLGRPRRIRITTTIEPTKLILLREHAKRTKKSLGQLANEYVDQRFPRSHGINVEVEGDLGAAL